MSQDVGQELAVLRDAHGLYARHLDEVGLTSGECQGKTWPHVFLLMPYFDKNKVWAGQITCFLLLFESAVVQNARLNKPSPSESNSFI